MELTPNFQKQNEPWTDEQGVTIPFNRINRVEKAKEKYAASIVRNAKAVSADLKALHNMVKKAEEDILELMKKEGKQTSKKGSYTWYNFDKSVRVEINNNDTVKFDEALLATAREKLDEFISDNTKGTDDIIRQLINTAFHQGSNGLDSRKILGLLKFRSKVKDHRFQEALNLISEAQIIDSSKKYYKISIKDGQGQYKYINLQFSNL
jgi:hypothetical protein